MFSRKIAFGLKGRKLSGQRRRSIITSVFDPVFYLASNKDVELAGIDPLDHYLKHGMQEGREPNLLFSVSWFVAQHPDAADDPLVHHLSGIGTKPHPLFDGEWYLNRYPDVRADGIHPLVHYIANGQEENRDPHPLFDATWYVSRYPDAKGAALAHYMAGKGVSPHPLFDDEFYAERYRRPRFSNTPALIDYIHRGFERDPNIFFYSDWYLSQVKGLREMAVTPLEHYCRWGELEGIASHPVMDLKYYAAQLRTEPAHGTLLADLLHDGDDAGRTPTRLFDPEWYLAATRGIASANAAPLQHYLKTGWRAGHSPHPLFDSAYYLANSPDVKAAGIEPLTHYLATGYRERRSAHPLFDIKFYIQSSPDVAAADAEPIQHYLNYGDSENRNPNALFDTQWYREQHETRLEAQNALLHYLTAGAAENRDPSPFFDRSYYIAANGDVRVSGIEPLSHYLSTGRAEGRSPRPADRFTDVCETLKIPYEIRQAPPALAGRNVCLFMSYTSNGEISPHVLLQLEAWQTEGYLVLLILATDGVTRHLPTELDACAGVLLRSNHGWDFAAWATAMAVFPDVWKARSLILTNDSLYGPVDRDAFRAILKSVHTSKADVVALTDSYQVRRHLMSYFTALTGTGLCSEALRRHWGGIKSIRDKQEVINQYELTSADTWRELGVTTEVLFPTKEDTDPPVNPTLHQWRNLIDRGFPFIKVQLLRDLLPETETTGWQDVFKSEPRILKAVKEHLDNTAEATNLIALAQKRVPQPQNYRPIPAPKRRFKRNFAPRTFYGATQSMRPRQLTDLALEVPFFNCTSLIRTGPIAIIAHIFYPEMTDILLAKFANIPVRADLYISTDTVVKQTQIAQRISSYSGGSSQIRVTPNVGRDVAAMLVGFRDVFDRYEIFLHVHSKKSPHDPRFAGWRDFLLENLLGTPEIIASNLRLLSLNNVGVVFSEHFQEIRNLLNWGYDFDIAKELLERIGVELRKDLVLDFPSSSFFWAKSAAVRPLLDLGLDWSDFPAERGQIDGTLAHAIERSILYIAEHAGFSWVKVSTARNATREALLPVVGEQEIKSCVERAYRPLLGNYLSPQSQTQTFPEIVPAATRKDPDSKPRFNLVIPSLHPKHIFGGLTTALNIFHGIADHLGGDFDRRIICTSAPVDLESMIGQSDYKLVPLGSISNNICRSIVDITDRESGELPIRRNDFFMTTAWWTALLGSSMQTAQGRIHGRELPWLYLIQDHEPGFYSWSSLYGLSQATYVDKNSFIGLINSEELANFMQKYYGLTELSVVPYAPNLKIADALKQLPRERIILIYGRPSVARNCFETICAGLSLWQQTDPVSAAVWQIVSAGEDYSPGKADGIANLKICGKMSLEDYADVLSRASIGVSLMLSPHPSYPPLEMAAAGLKTITNAYDCKDLSLRSSNIMSLTEVTPQNLAIAIAGAVREAESRIGKTVNFSEISNVPTRVRPYDAAALAQRISTLVTSP